MLGNPYDDKDLVAILDCVDCPTGYYDSLVS